MQLGNCTGGLFSEGHSEVDSWKLGLRFPSPHRNILPFGTIYETSVVQSARL